MKKFFAYNSDTRELVAAFPAADADAARAFADRYYTRGGRDRLTVYPRRMGAPWLTAAATHRRRAEALAATGLPRAHHGPLPGRPDRAGR